MIISEMNKLDGNISNMKYENLHFAFLETLLKRKEK